MVAIRQYANRNKSGECSMPFSIYSMPFPPFGTTDMGLTPIGVGPDPVNKEANQ